MNSTVIKKFLAVLEKLKILGNVCFSEQMFYRGSLWVPLKEGRTLSRRTCPLF